MSTVQDFRITLREAERALQLRANSLLLGKLAIPYAIGSNGTVTAWATDMANALATKRRPPLATYRALELWLLAQ